jgi:hypothetical protein
MVNNFFKKNMTWRKVVTEHATWEEEVIPFHYFDLRCSWIRIQTSRLAPLLECYSCKRC